MYAVMLGDFELAEYKEPLSVAVIFFFFTILGVIILLNVLIAVISDSYEKSKESSLLLFGRARVHFVAEQIALESFLRPGRNPLMGVKNVLDGTPLARDGNVGTIWKCTSNVVRWIFILSLLGSTVTTTFFLLGEMLKFRDLSRPGLFFFYLFMTLVLLVATWTVCTFVFSDLFRFVFRGPLQRCIKFGERWTGVIINVVVVHFLGLHSSPSSRDHSFFGEEKEHNAFTKEEDNQDEDLKERMFIMEKSLQKAVSDTKRVLTKRIATTEERLMKEEKKERILLLKKLSKLINQLEDQDQKSTRKGKPE